MDSTKHSEELQEVSSEKRLSLRLHAAQVKLTHAQERASRLDGTQSDSVITRRVNRVERRLERVQRYSATLEKSLEQSEESIESEDDSISSTSDTHALSTTIPFIFSPASTPKTKITDQHVHTTPASSRQTKKGVFCEISTLLMSRHRRMSSLNARMRTFLRIRPRP